MSEGQRIGGQQDSVHGVNRAKVKVSSLFASAQGVSRALDRVSSLHRNVQMQCTGGIRAAHRGSAERQRTGIGGKAKDRDHCWQIRGQGSPLTEQSTAIIGGKEKDRDYQWKSRAQGSPVERQRSGITS